jgi:hypothetical protein
MLHHAGKETIPGYNKQVSLKPTGRSIWNSLINEALQESKKAFKSLKRNRENNCETEYDRQNMIKKRGSFRSLQRQAHASKQRNFIQENMDASENDSKTFSKLINKQRTNAYKDTGSLIVIGKNVTITEDILEQWKHHFQKLAIPNLLQNLI